MKVKTKPVNRKKISWLLQQEIHIQFEMLRHHIELCRMLVNEMLNDEVNVLAGERYKHNKPMCNRYSRWGFNPGSVRVGDEKVRIDVPRIYDNQEQETIPLTTYKQLKEIPAVDDQLLKRVISGISTGDYRSAIQNLVDSFGLSRSSVSNRFIEVSTEKLEEFTKRDLSQHDFIALFIDGKYLAKEQIIIVLGVTLKGEKIPLGFIQTNTENSGCIKELLSGLIERGLRYKEGILCIIDGSKGIRKAISEVFGRYALVQRCQWHKRENVLNYLKESSKAIYRKRINKAYHADTYLEAKKMLLSIIDDLEIENTDAANSLKEGFEETLTLHKLDLVEELRASFTTTNCIENVNSLMIKHLGKVKYWKNSDQRHRWVACALLEIEQRLRKVDNYKKLHLLKNKIMMEVNKKVGLKLKVA
jgi:transposase-like protein